MNYAVMICTHGRPYRQYTLETLRNAGYEGEIYLITDNEDETVPKLIHEYGSRENMVLVFDKQKFIDATDRGTMEDQRKCIVYAKNFCEYVAKELKLDAFIIADDDIKSFRYRYNEDGKLKSHPVWTIENVLESYIKMMLDCDLVATGFGMAQMYIGGLDDDDIQKYRVPYNFVFRNAKHDVDWVSWYGEDIITAVLGGCRGEKWMTAPYIQQEIVALGEADGGMKDTYDSSGSFKLAMQNLIYCPTQLEIYPYKHKFMAGIRRNNAFPKLVSSQFQLK